MDKIPLFREHIGSLTNMMNNSPDQGWNHHVKTNFESTKTPSERFTFSHGWGWWRKNSESTKVPPSKRCKNQGILLGFLMATKTKRSPSKKKTPKIHHSSRVTRSGVTILGKPTFDSVVDLQTRSVELPKSQISKAGGVVGGARGRVVGR